MSMKPLLDDSSTGNTNDSRFTDWPLMPPVGAAFLMCSIYPSLLAGIALHILSLTSCKHI